MNGLLADLQDIGDRLPTPSLFSRIGNLHGFKLVGQGAQGAHGGEATGWVAVTRGGCKRCLFGLVAHAVK